MSDRKGTRETRAHAERRKKRKFPGNRYTLENDLDYTSASAKKLLGSMNLEVPVASNFAYCILEFASVFSAISANVICKECKNDVTFSQTILRGLGFKILMSCVGHEGANLFCSLLDICQGIGNSTYTALLENIHTAASAVYESVLSFAATQEKNMNEEAGKPQIELTVSGDGTWKKRGFSSLFGVSTLIEKYSGKVIDAMVMNSFCGACNLWKKLKNTEPEKYEAWYADHESECSINHTGSSGKMEIDAIIAMFLRSIEKHGVKYLTYVGDGDSKTFNGILKAEPYGNDSPVIKKECVGHVEKRMGTRLRNVKKNNKGIGGKGQGKLTDKLIIEMTKCYGLAIRRHPDSLEEMKKEVWATFYHKCSTDENPQHQNCPAGEGSWCKWRQAEAKSTLDQFHHEKAPLSKEVQAVVKSIYEDLSKDDLLTRCLGAETQNNNESLNSLIWTFAPKHLHSGAQIVQIATFLAVVILNEGFQGIIKIMHTMGCSIGRSAHAYVERRDKARISRSEQRMSDAAREVRISAREEQSALRNLQEEEEGILYAPGIAD
ncbi:PREDICTED: uncharacterized protein LOC106743225 isoform X2 [Dinoponera quadriceps]|uniref:Uncharacterized protein LOC106743225 isoform X2 n=1 Tax=Dinoponera quadriceps TaxID=609295 RepID=A0A6P3X3A9_DINQU|nr:PREDICTED: uncharacterized protein LOC106743225 isoform X2 [Dinoponera quadriceps]